MEAQPILQMACQFRQTNSLTLLCFFSLPPDSLRTQTLFLHFSFSRSNKLSCPPSLELDINLPSSDHSSKSCHCRALSIYDQSSSITNCHASESSPLPANSLAAKPTSSLGSSPTRASFSSRLHHHCHWERRLNNTNLLHHNSNSIELQLLHSFPSLITVPSPTNGGCKRRHHCHLSKPSIIASSSTTAVCR